MTCEDVFQTRRWPSRHADRTRSSPEAGPSWADAESTSTALTQSSCWNEATWVGGIWARTYSTVRRVSADMPLLVRKSSIEVRRNCPLMRNSRGTGLSVSRRWFTSCERLKRLKSARHSGQHRCAQVCYVLRNSKLSVHEAGGTSSSRLHQPEKKFMGDDYPNLLVFTSMGPVFSGSARSSWRVVNCSLTCVFAMLAVDFAGSRCYLPVCLTSVIREADVFFPARKSGSTAVGWRLPTLRL